MKDKKMVAAIVGVLVVIAVVMITTGKMRPVVKSAKPASTKTPGAAPVKVAAKKIFSENAGGLTAKVLNYKGAGLELKGSAFIAMDPRSSVHKAEITSNIMQELPAGTYDIVMNTVPRMIYKNIIVSEGKETIKDIESMGAITVKMLNSKKLPAAYPVRVFSGKVGSALVLGSTNRPIDIMSGAYEIEIGGIPPFPRKMIKVFSGKEAIEDIGCVTGSMTVKVVDASGKEVRSMFMIRKAGKRDVITAGSTNNPVEIAEGIYDVEVSLRPSQVKSGIKITAGDSSVVEFTAVPQAIEPSGQKIALPRKPAK